MDKKKIIIMAVVLIAILIALVAGTESFRSSTSSETVQNNTGTTSKNGSTESTTISTTTVANAKINASDIFTTRDLKQEADLTGATKYTVSDNTDIEINKEGVYVISGSAKNATINVTAGEEDKVQLVLDHVTIENQDKECIHVETADKVFVTTSAQSSLTYKTTDVENATGAILSRSDLILNGTSTLTINSENNGIVGKDDVKITGGTYNITTSKNAIRANDSIAIAEGTLTLKAGTDGLHAENNDDDTKGYIYVGSGTININAADDAIHAVSVVQIDGGTIDITAAEGVEGTYIQINDGTISMKATDDGINAARKSTAYTPTVEINGGSIKIDMGQGDTDGIDSNGDIIVNGGTIEVTGNSTFDYDGKAEKNGGTIIINGVETDTIPNQMMGGGMRGGRGQMFQQGADGTTMPNDLGGGEFPRDMSGDFGGMRGGRGFRQENMENLNGEFPPEFNGQKPMKGNRQQTTEQTSEENVI